MLVSNITVGVGLQRVRHRLDASFEIRPGKQQRIVGGLASGKTGLGLFLGTAARNYASALVEPDFIDADEEGATRSAFVPTSPYLSFTGLVGDVRGELEWRCRDRQRVIRLTEDFHLAPLLKRSPWHLSGGEATRLSLALAVAPAPASLVIDDIGALLDNEARTDICRLLKSTAFGQTTSLEFALDGAHSILDIGTAEIYLGPGHRPHTDEAIQVLADLHTIVAPSFHSIRADEVRILYPGGVAVGPLSLDARPGEIVWVKGPNGSGKTTLLRALCGYRRVVDGRVVLNDTATTTSNSAAARLQNICFYLVQQSEYQFVGPTVADELTRHLRSVPHHLTQAAIKLAQAILRAPPLHINPFDLPRGLQKLVLVLIGILSPKPVLLLDEPSLGVPADSKRFVAAAIRWAAERGKAIVLVSHDADFAQACATKTIDVRKAAEA